MDGRVSIVVGAAAVMICGAFVADGSGAQASKNRPVVAGCPSVSAKFHSCALAKARSFTPPRTLNGEPDLTGLWDAPLAQGFQNGTATRSSSMCGTSAVVSGTTCAGISRLMPSTSLSG